MIPLWLIPIECPNSHEFVFDEDGTEVRVSGICGCDGWVVSARIHIFGITGYGFSGRTYPSGAWEEILMPILQKAANDHKGNFCGRDGLIRRMRMIWASH